MRSTRPTWSLRTQLKAFLRVKEAIEANELTMAFVNEKIRRILLAKGLSELKSSLSSSRQLAQEKNSLSQKLKTIEQSVLESNLKSQGQKFESITADAHFCVVSPSRHFLDSFKKGTPLKIKYLWMNTLLPHFTLEGLLTKGACQKSVVSVYGEKTTKLAESLSPEAKANVVLVNLNAPMSLVDKTAYLSVVNLYFPHTSAGQMLAQHMFHRKPAEAYPPRATSR